MLVTVRKVFEVNFLVLRAKEWGMDLARVMEMELVLVSVWARFVLLWVFAREMVMRLEKVKAAYFARCSSPKFFACPSGYLTGVLNGCRRLVLPEKG